MGKANDNFDTETTVDVTETTVEDSTDTETEKELCETKTVPLKEVKSIDVDAYHNRVKNSINTFIQGHKEHHPTFEVIGMFSLNAIVFKDKTTHEIYEYSNTFIEGMPRGTVGTAITTEIKNNPMLLIDVTSVMKEEMRQYIEEHRENMNKTYSTNN